MSDHQSSQTTPTTSWNLDSHSHHSPAPSTLNADDSIKPCQAALAFAYDAAALKDGATKIHTRDWSPLLDQTPVPPTCEVRQVPHLGFAHALAAQKPRKFTRAMCKLYLYLFVASLNSIINGFNGTINGGLSTISSYNEYFGLDPESTRPADSHTVGMLLAAYTVGNIVGSFFCGPFTDRWGRRWGMFWGAAVIIMGTAVQGLATQISMFILGRCLLGFGIALCATAGPCYVAEMAHPAWRGTLTGVYNTFWSIGALPASWIIYAVNKLLQGRGNLQWRLPVWLQCVTAGALLGACLFIPETPRWLFANDLKEEATQVLARYHGEGNRKSPIVQLTYREMVQELYIEGSDKRWWDYSDLYSTKQAWWRNSCIWGMAICSQWAGGGALAYFMPRLVDQAGVDDKNTQLLYGGIMNVLSLSISLVSSCLIERFGRRPLLLTGTSLFVLWWILITALTASYAGSNENPEANGNMHGSKAAIAFIYIFGLTYSFSYTPLQALYPVECLQYETRAKGMGIYNLVVNIAMLFNTYGLPNLLAIIQWKLYYIYVVWNVVQVIFIYFFFVETKGRTLEEINEIFKAPYPKAKSLERHKIVISQALVSGEFVEMYDAP